MRIERRLDELSEEGERLRAALDALGPSDTSRPSPSPPERTAPRDRTGAVLEARTDGQSPRAREPATPMTGAERAVQSLRRELAAGLRNGRR